MAEPRPNSVSDARPSGAAADILRAIERLVSDAVCVIDRAGEIQRANPAAQELLGVGARPGYYHGLCDAAGRQLEDAANPLLAAVSEGVAVNGAAVWWRRPDGERIPLLLRLEPLPGRDGEPPSAVAVFHPTMDETAHDRTVETVRTDALRVRHLLDVVCDYADIGVLLAESDGRLAMVNRAFESLTGHTLEVGQPLPPIEGLLQRDEWAVDERQLDILGMTVAAAARSLEPLSFELETRSVHLEIHTCRLAAGRRIWMFHDQTERRRLIRELERARDQAEVDRNLLRQVFANVTSGLGAVDESRRLVAFNRALHEIWQLDEAWLRTQPGAEELVSRVCRLLAPAQELELRAWIERVGRTSGTGNIEFQRPDGRTVLIHTTPMGDGRQLYTSRDLTDQRRLEQSLSARNEELARALAEQEATSRQLALANLQLQESDRLKSEFLANTSHELRTPLNTILGYLGLITDGLYQTETEAQQFARKAQGSAEILLHQISDLLDIARAEAGQMAIRREAIALWPALEEACDEIRAAARDKGLELVLPAEEVDWTVSGDPERLRQVFWNVLDNAVKFTPGGSVTVELDRSRPGLITAVVRDTGIGISAEQIERVFDKFVQADGSSARSYGGTGLGLALTRCLVELMGGSINVESDGQGHGTAIRIELPEA